MVTPEKGIYADADDYVVFYGYRRETDIENCTFHVAPPPPGELRKEKGDYSLRWLEEAYNEF